MKNRSWILNDLEETAEELAWDHRMDISASVYTRMQELGINETELAQRIGVDKSQISRLIKGKRNLTIQAIAEIEEALQFRLDAGFKYYTSPIRQQSVTSSTLIRDNSRVDEFSHANPWNAPEVEEAPMSRIINYTELKGVAA